MSNYTRLGGASANFDAMIRKFGVVTVMNAKVYEYSAPATTQTVSAFVTALANPICELKTLKIANVTIEGPSKTVTGGQYSNPLIKFGKTARLEMQDALGEVDAIDNLCGGVAEWSASTSGATGTARTYTGLHFGADFNSAKTIVGDTFFIDQATGQQKKVRIVFFQFLPDSIFNLTQDAEGDATVFDMNGDLLATEMLIGTTTGTDAAHSLFYSIIDEAAN